MEKNNNNSDEKSRLIKNLLPWMIDSAMKLYDVTETKAEEIIKSATDANDVAGLIKSLLEGGKYPIESIELLEK